MYGYYSLISIIFIQYTWKLYAAGSVTSEKRPSSHVNFLHIQSTPFWTACCLSCLWARPSVQENSQMENFKRGISLYTRSQHTWRSWAPFPHSVTQRELHSVWFGWNSSNISDDVAAGDMSWSASVDAPILPPSQTDPISLFEFCLERNLDKQHLGSKIIGTLQENKQKWL